MRQADSIPSQVRGAGSTSLTSAKTPSLKTSPSMLRVSPNPLDLAAMMDLASVPDAQHEHNHRPVVDAIVESHDTPHANAYCVFTGRASFSLPFGRGLSASALTLRAMRRAVSLGSACSSLTPSAHCSIR